MEAAVSQKVPFWRSLRTKYALTYLVLIAAVLALLNSYPIIVSQTMIFQSKQTSLQGQATVMASALAGPEGLDAEGARRVLELLGDAGLSRVVVTDPAGKVLYDSRPDAGTEGRYALTGEITAALSGRDEFRCDYRGGVFDSRSAVPVTYRGMTLGAVYVNELDAEQGRLLQNIQQTLRTISLVIVLLSVALSLIFSQALTRRLGQLLDAIRTVREGEYSHRLDVGGRDELSRLAGEFNALTRRLQTTEEARRRFVSDASHELKTPLASIRLLSDSILQNDAIDPATAREFVEDIGAEAERLHRITEHLLTLTRLDAALPVQTQAVDVSAVALRVEHMLSPLAQAAGVTLHLRLGNAARILATDDDLYQILFNLVENGIKYNLPGGRVEVEVTCPDQRVVITVTDTGVGIPAQDMDKVFDRFYRVDKARSRQAGGTGLGLSIVRDTALRHQGTVEARRRVEGEGTCFVVTFPRLREEGEA